MSMIKNHPKLDLVIAVRHFLPGSRWGGPTQSVANICNLLGSQMRIGVICLDRDFRSTEPYEGINADVWEKHGLLYVKYCSPGEFGPRAIVNAVKETGAETLYLNSFWDYTGGFKVLLWNALFPMSCRILLAPRGEFQPSAMRLGRAKAKSVVLHLSKVLNVWNGIEVHVTSPMELENLLTYVPQLCGRTEKVHLLPNLPSMHFRTSDLTCRSKPVGECRAVSVSRIAPVKGVLELVESVQSLGTWFSLDLIGDADNDHYDHAVNLAISEVEGQCKIRRVGALGHSDLAAILRDYDVFFLNTRGENYGHAIVEALAAGVPVAIGPNTPWSDVETFGAGWLIREHGDIRDIATKVREMDESELMSRRLLARKYFDERVLSRGLVESYKALLKTN